MTTNTGQHNIIMRVIVFMIPLTGAGVDIHVPSLPSIIAFFHTNQSTVQSSISLYLLGYGIGQFFIGTMSDSIGRRPVILYGSLCDMLACLASTLSTNMTVFLITRLIQGLAIAGPGMAAKACIADMFQGKELHKASNTITIAFSAGLIIAPALGGYLQHYINWKACFYFLTLYTFLIYVLCLLYFKETKLQKSSLDIKNLTTNLKKVSSHPIIIGSIITGGISYSIMTIFNVMGPFIIQAQLHYTAAQYGHCALILGCFWLMGNMASRKIQQHIAIYPLYFYSICALAILCVAYALTLPLLPFTLATVILPAITIYIVGGLLQSLRLSITLSVYPDLAGTVTAISGMTPMIITAFLGWVASLFSTHTQIPLFDLYLGCSVCMLLLCFFLIGRKTPKV